VVLASRLLGDDIKSQSFRLSGEGT
jgi:hypothetical protein